MFQHLEKFGALSPRQGYGGIVDEVDETFAGEALDVHQVDEVRLMT